MGPLCMSFFFFFQAEDGIRDIGVTGVQTCALPICCRAVCAKHLHTFFELSLVRVVVAAGTIQVRPTVDHCRLGLELWTPCDTLHKVRPSARPSNRIAFPYVWRA